MMGFVLWHPPSVDTRDILAANVNALIDRSKDPSAHRRLVERGIPNGTLGRIRTAAVGTSVDNLEKLAAGLGIPAWLLLVTQEKRDAMFAMWHAANSLIVTESAKVVALPAPKVAPDGGGLQKTHKQKQRPAAVRVKPLRGQ